MRIASAGTHSKGPEPNHCGAHGRQWFAINITRHEAWGPTMWGARSLGSAL